VFSKGGTPGHPEGEGRKRFGKKGFEGGWDSEKNEKTTTGKIDPRNAKVVRLTVPQLKKTPERCKRKKNAADGIVVGKKGAVGAVNQTGKEKKGSAY